ncbi:NAD-dependent succinate-semialdehyde dehydrogenase [Yaniella halotolerans]|uniref:NAD-dependent succinate-semialdehyde dehydrogenase n=1 Tax=Yaniella halotolerans TaxID=225453 RepID=UPI0003B7A0D0|nr:NAD-dependent succinate-semialdehyde dehydrogenase [Yaniella halotolerans]
MYQVKNPATGEVEATYPEMSDAEVAEAVEQVDQGYREWNRRPLSERQAIVWKAADLFDERKEELAKIIAREMGKPVGQGIGEAETSRDIFRYYADNAEQLLANEELDIEGGRALLQKKSIGALVGIMPWNFPYYQVARFAAPNLILGNTMLLKHARNCPESAAAIEQLLRDAGLPENAYINMYASSDQIADVIADPRIFGVSLTGSERAGVAVGKNAGQHLKPMVLELGGSDPLLVLDTNDVQAVATKIAQTRLRNAGQACNSPKRLIVMDEYYDEFVEVLVREFENAQVGDPMDPKSVVGPISSAQALEELIEQVQDTVKAGATLHTGGERLSDKGTYFSPAVLTDVTPEMRGYYEELFGPVAIVYRAKTVDDALRLANDSPFGLGSSIFTEDPEAALEVADQIETGMVFFNEAGGSQPDLPFGGVKRSGIGRELGPLGIEEFMNKKVVRF